MSAFLQYATDPYYQALVLAITVPTAIQCLIAIWAGVSQVHWFWRALAVWAGLALLIPIRAYEPVWLFAISSPLIVAALLLNRRRDSVKIAQDESPAAPLPLLRFGVRDLFLLILIAALVLMVLLEAARHYQPENWAGWITMSLLLPAIPLLAYQCVTAPRRRIRCLILLAAALPLAATGMWLAGDYMRVFSNFFYVTKGHTPAFNAILTLSLIGAELSLLIMISVALARAGASTGGTLRARIAKRIGAAAALTAVTVLLAGVYWQMLPRAAMPPTFETPVNHAARIVAIAERVNTINPQNVSLAELRATPGNTAVVKELESLYQELLPLLDAPNAVEYDPEHDATWEQAGNAIPFISTHRALARCLQAEAESARSNGQFDSAADYALAIVRLAAMLRRGGRVLYAMPGMGIESVAHTELARLHPTLSPEKAREVIEVLQRSAAEHEAAADLVAREIHFEQEAFGWQVRLDDIISRRGGHASLEVAVTEPAKRSRVAQLLLQGELAIRVYQQDHGRRPEQLRELVPDYLPAVPLDPYSGKPPIFQSEQDSHVLYSVGWDGVDNGGTFGNRAAYNNSEIGDPKPGLDFDLDTLTRP